jgi:GT2 family glycosyltransferase
MQLTVATTTRNRQDSVLRLLDSLAPQLELGDELIVVDNGSTDGTGTAVGQWILANCPSGRLVVEARGGTSQARNTALSASTRSVVCFLDDDATVEQGWLAAMRRAWERASEQTAMIGGPIRPDWDGGMRPAWVSDDLLWIVTALDLGSEPRRLGRERIWGANMSLRVESVLAVGGFDLDLGPRPGVEFGRDEEEDLQNRLQAQGFWICWEPNASVQHHLPAARVDPTYFQSFMRSQGRRHALQKNVTTWRAAYRSTRTAVRCASAGLLRNDPRRIEARINLSYWTSALRTCVRVTLARTDTAR